MNPPGSERVGQRSQLVDLFQGIGVIHRASDDGHALLVGGASAADCGGFDAVTLGPEALSILDKIGVGKINVDQPDLRRRLLRTTRAVRWLELFYNPSKLLIKPRHRLASNILRDPAVVGFSNPARDASKSIAVAPQRLLHERTLG
jgi:hypothetical protein